MVEITEGTILVDEDGLEYVVSSVTTRIVVITRNGRFVESVTHAFANRKYKIKKG